ESIGWPRVLDQWLVRNRIVGGSSHTWAGRCAPFDEIDFARRDWVAHSGWPFDLDHMRPYLERTPTYLGLGAGADYADDRFWSRLCENARDWRPDYVRGDTGEDLAERRREIRESSPASI
ncbi:MAG TPA: hypothetical protein VGT81_18310, partial [Casimicrobiaceae bacterium]|nr:hypothetical protein [Casimicrobiaceae bacterium]